MTGSTTPPVPPPGFTAPPQDDSYLPSGQHPVTVSDRGASAGIPAASLPKDSPAASLPTSTTGGALATAPTAQPDADKRWTVKSILIVTFIGVWLLFGLVGFILSLVCLGYSGSVGEKILGIVIALVLGPWYFVYYFSDAGYCKRMPPTLF